jgi:uncharacterized protein DUF87
VQLPLGVDEFGEAVHLEAPATEGRHLLILGETGMGKSSALLRLARRGAEVGAVILLDPIGDTARRLLELLPPGRSPPVRVISAARDRTGINALACLEPGREDGSAGGERMVEELVQALRQVRLARYPDTPFWGPRIDEQTSAALRAAAASPGATLAEAFSLLDDTAPVFHGWGPEGRAAVAGYRSWSASRREEAEGARRLLGEVTRSAVLRRLLCAPSPKWALEGLDEPGKVTVISGDAPEVGESAARYLLGVYLALLWSRLLARSRPGKVFLLLDEIQWYGHGALAEFLRLGRRANVHVFAATQSLASLPEALQEPVRTNVADLLLYRGDPLEAREFSRWIPSAPPERLLALPRGHALLLAGKGSDVRWVETVPPVPSRQRSRSDPLPPEPGPEGAPPEPGSPQPRALKGDGGASEATSGLPLAGDWACLLSVAADVGRGRRRVYLRELRGAGQLSDGQVRALGAQLRREGVLLETGGVAGERWWEFLGVRDRAPPAPP